MNSEAIQEFLVKLGFSVDEHSLSKFMGGLDSAAIRIAGFGAAMAAVAVEVVHSIEEIANENRQLGLLAQQMNTTAGAVDDFIDTAKILGISAEDSTASLKAFASNVSDAAMGIGRAKLVFEKLGIAVKDASGNMRSASDVMEDLKVKLAGMNRAQQLRIMEKLGLDPKLLAMFNDAFGQTAKIADQLSAIDVAAGFDLDKSIKQSNEFEKSWAGMRTEVNLFKMLFEKMHEAIAVRMMPGIQVGVENITKAIESARHFIMDNAKKIEDALQPILETIISIGSAVAQLTFRAFQLMGDLISPVLDILMKANEYTHGWIFKIGALIVAWKAFNLSFLASPLGIILGLAAALLLLYDDFKGWKEGKESAIDWASGTGTAIIYTVGILGSLAASLVALSAVQRAYAIGAKIVAAAQMLMNIAFTPAGLIIIGIVAAIGLLAAAGYMLIKHWYKVKAWFTDFFGWFENKGKQFANMASAFTGNIGNSLHKIEGTIIGTGGSNAHNVVNQNTTVHVNGAQNPQATAQAVAVQQHQVNAQITRNMTARAR